MVKARRGLKKKSPRTKTRSIGLLGGSFNPAHGGHLHITLYALKKLGFDEVWWLVSPQNPLKKAESLAAYEQRLQSAKDVAKAHPGIRVLDIEAKMGTRYSWQTIALLQQRFARVHFAWLMGADNLEQFHRWKKWRNIFASLPVIVFDRAPYSHTALRSRAYTYMHKFLLKSISIHPLKTAPNLVFVHLRRDPMSSSHLRKTLGKNAFLRHN